MSAVRGALGACLLLLLGATAHAATFTIRPLEGFDDATPVSPSPGNPATTLGQARLNVLTEAARIWGSLLVSNVPIVVDASFSELECDVGGLTTLASAGPTVAFDLAGNAPNPNVLYVSALADSIRGMDLLAMSGMPNLADITISLNSRFNNDPLCAGGGRFYLGFDHNPPFGQQDLLTIVLHELAHGLGFVSLVNLDPDAVDDNMQPVPVGASLASSGKLASYDQFVFDESLNMAWPMLTPEQRQASASRSNQIAWNGTNVNRNLASLTVGRSGGSRLLLSAPAMVVAGSSISHFDSSVSPDILMEPVLRSNLPGTTDVTVCAMQDIGWRVTRCPDLTTAAPPPMTGTPGSNPIGMTPRQGGGGGGGGALYLPLLFALAGLVPLRSWLGRKRLRRGLG